METRDTKFRPIDEELKRIARSRRPGKPRFRFPITREAAYDVLLACFDAEVARRGGDFQATDFILDKIDKLACMITAEKPKFGVLMTGTAGNGKTTLVRAFNQAARYLLDAGYIDHELYNFRHKSDFGLEFYTSRDVASVAHTDNARFKNLMSVPMLAIDDLGEEPKEVLEHGNALNPVVEVLEKRYNDQLFTMITTNLDAEEITAKYGARIADRLREMVSIIVFGDHSSFRR